MKRAVMSMLEQEDFQVLKTARNRRFLLSHDRRIPVSVGVLVDIVEACGTSFTGAADRA